VEPAILDTRDPDHRTVPLRRENGSGEPAPPRENLAVRERVELGREDVRQGGKARCALNLPVQLRLA
jgi:hypothetical protein